MNVPVASAPRIVPRAEHTISRAHISPNALKVLYRLNEAGFQAFLVGGAVRDLLLGIRPKDFDVATNALPEEVRRLFRNSRLIGRRFRLAHVHFGPEIIEVATFRASSAPEREDSEEESEEGTGGAEPLQRGPLPQDLAQSSVHRQIDERGRIVRDNLYGNIEDDVWRRDFAANALYYNIEDFSLWDYVDGLDDVRARRLRLIGPPEQRLREDPVRMLRAVRFAAKLGFAIDPQIEELMPRLGFLLDAVPPARLFDEVLKLFLTGFGVRAYDMLQRFRLFEHLFPQSAAAFGLEPYAYAEGMMRQGLANTDERVEAGKPISPAFFFSIVLWAAILRQMNERQAGGSPDVAALMGACDAVLRTQQARISIPKRFGIPMREILALQPRFNRRAGGRALSLLDHPRFRAAFDFLLLRSQAGAAEHDVAQWWQEIQEVPADERLRRAQAMVQGQGGDAAATGRPRRRRRRRPAS